MIIGIGSDLVDISRIDKTLKKFGTRFINRCFSKNEIKLSEKSYNKASYYAKKFAAKEAFTKAFGTGISNGVYFKDIEIYNNKYGKPIIKLYGNVKKQYNLIEKNKNDLSLNLSITDEKNLAHAFVIISN